MVAPQDSEHLLTCRFKFRNGVRLVNDLVHEAALIIFFRRKVASHGGVGHVNLLFIRAVVTGVLFLIGHQRDDPERNAVEHHGAAHNVGSCAVQTLLHLLSNDTNPAALSLIFRREEAPFRQSYIADQRVIGLDAVGIEGGTVIFTGRARRIFEFSRHVAHQVSFRADVVNIPLGQAHAAPGALPACLR